MRQYLPLICLALMHTLVDACALLIEPLWPKLEVTFALTGVAALSTAFVLQSLPTSLSQAVFGYIRDLRKTPHLLWLGPVIAVVCLTSMGLATNRYLLGLLLLIGGIGVGAFHPEAAVVAGRAFPEQRTRALSLFMFGGSLGLGLGPVISGILVSRWGLSGLVAAMPVMLILIALLWRVGRLSEITKKLPAPKPGIGPAEMLAGRGLTAFSLLLVCSLRLVPNMAMAKVIAFEMARRGHEELFTGVVQSLFLVSASAGMFVMMLGFRSGWEKRFMILCPLLGLPVLLVLGIQGCPEWLFIATLIPAGMVLWGTSPAMVSYGQQLFPQGAGVASAVTMGLSWGLGGLIQAPITAYYQSIGAPNQAFHAFIPCLAAATLGAWLMPALGSEVDRSIVVTEINRTSEKLAEQPDASQSAS